MIFLTLWSNWNDILAISPKWYVSEQKFVSVTPHNMAKIREPYEIFFCSVMHCFGEIDFFKFSNFKVPYWPSLQEGTDENWDGATISPKLWYPVEILKIGLITLVPYYWALFLVSVFDGAPCSCLKLSKNHLQGNFDLPNSYP